MIGCDKLPRERACWRLPGAAGQFGGGNPGERGGGRGRAPAGRATGRRRPEGQAPSLGLGRWVVDDAGKEGRARWQPKRGARGFVVLL